MPGSENGSTAISAAEASPAVATETIANTTPSRGGRVGARVATRAGTSASTLSTTRTSIGPEFRMISATGDGPSHESTPRRRGLPSTISLALRSRA